jgi:hypothetical protein
MKQKKQKPEQSPDVKEVFKLKQQLKSRNLRRVAEVFSRIFGPPRHNPRSFFLQAQSRLEVLRVPSAAYIRNRVCPSIYSGPDGDNGFLL